MSGFNFYEYRECFSISIFISILYIIVTGAEKQMESNQEKVARFYKSYQGV